ncbi:MAG: 16S rRNA (guanine(527)-N(7))-methyltransferase RsmG [Saprospiraceae bacterium]|nr:16S rRNA (guanine(527)-N(7))-methyltransferase RsmG [Saprospiraceae bacterium]
MTELEMILQYFPNLSDIQQKQFAALPELYKTWNEQINVISRKDIDNLIERHVLHSLAIAKVVKPRTGAEILDLGTGGGFPGIPMAILFPDVKFLLVDGTGKKIRVVNEVIQALGLENAVGQQTRAEELKKRKFDFVFTRAVATLDKLAIWTQHLYKRDQRHALPNGLFALKGGNLGSEIKALPKGNYTEVFPISEFFKEAFFEGKSVVYLQA